MSYTLPTTYTTGNITISTASGTVGAMAAIGSSNSIYTWNGAGGYTAPIFNISQTNNTIDIKGNVSVSEDSRLKISNTDIDVKWDYLINSIKEINRRLKIVIPDKEMFAQYPTLKDAYDQYQLTSEIEPKFLSNEFLQAYENYTILEAMLKDNK